MMRKDALLVLEDGTAFRGEGFGASGTAFGEGVFNTALTGYQEVLTDPSYHRQLVAMTYPHQGEQREAIEQSQDACRPVGDAGHECRHVDDRYIQIISLSFFLADEVRVKLLQIMTWGVEHIAKDR
jgi:carbamoylphosphate synthase small subunit